jgi:hypothetical protein
MAEREERRDPERLQQIIAEVAREIVPEAVKHTFGNLGLDVSTPDSRIQAQKDFSHLRTSRLRRERFWEGAGAQFTKMAMTALGVIGVLGIVAWIKGHL